ncbi:MAG: hypothetical protein QOH26_554 [Actinomycetota bacterium]|nr:hypothetical protein [Actinomycetota bacterium]
MRISMLDQPGMLGAVATALSRGGANIMSLDVIDREDGIAVDDLQIEAPDGLTEALRLAAEQVPGAVVEAVRPLEAFRDVPTPMELAAILAEATGSVALYMLVDGLPGAMWASWCVALAGGSGRPEVLAASVGSPSLTNVDTPWLPLEQPRRFDAAPWMPPAWKMGRMGYAVAAAPLGRPEEAVLIARKYGPRWRPSELRQLGLLTRMATAAGARTIA